MNEEPKHALIQFKDDHSVSCGEIKFDKSCRSLAEVVEVLKRVYAAPPHNMPASRMTGVADRCLVLHPSPAP